MFIVLSSFFVFIVFVVIIIRFLRNRVRKQCVNFGLTAWDRKLLMYHEAGHATVFISLFGVDKLKSVTIDPTNESFGNIKIIKSKNHNDTLEELLNSVAVSLAGRVAEEKYLNVTSTSCIHDIRNATFIANNIVTKFGMGDLGLLQIDEKLPLFYISENLKERISNNVLKIISDARAKAEDVLKANDLLYSEIVKELNLRNTLSTDVLNKIVNCNIKNDDI